ncbi:MAG TPA: adenylate/guanylate cyclase domain-containing protein [Burkholderiales bacterium]|nr:adenylate/guanylate cyclase domain-containing protein [Burkholderiales bacterium]
MSGAELKQRLAAILAADVAGYSRLMAADERGTVAALDAARRVFKARIDTSQGRVIDMAGDSVLAVFETATGAVSAALAIQQEIASSGGDMPEALRMRFRIGVHLGDVIEKPDGTIYGDGVNIAARLEGLAAPGGITVSDAVQGAVRGKVAANFIDQGEQTVKNIPHPVRAYSVQAAGAPAVSAAAAPGPQASEKPSIIVLPFANMSGAAEQEFFADGLTEDILTDLSRFRELFVISRNTSFKYKGQAVDVKKVARELGVRYVVEGSVRKAGNRVRITVQLIEAESDRHIWAERYDRELEDIFAIQDEVTSAIVATLPGRLEADARGRAERKLTANMAAYECVLEAKLLHHRSNRADNARAVGLIRRAIELDPQYGHAHAWQACILGQQWGYGWCEDRSATETAIEKELEVALGLDQNDSDVHRILAALWVIRDNLDKSSFHQQRALALNPNDDLIVVQQGEILTWLGQPEEGIEWIRKAMKLNPYHPERFWFHLARAQFAAKRYAEAIESLRRLSAPDALHHALLAACHAQLGNSADAAAQVAEVLKRVPGFTIREHCLPVLHYKRESDLAHHRESLRKAGLPD